MRIREALLAKRDWDVRATLALQMDVTSLPWREIGPALLAVDPGGDGDARVALTWLRDWDGQVAGPSVAAAIFEVFCDEITRAIVRAKAPKSWEWALGRTAHRIVPFSTYHTRRLADVVRLLREQPEGWLPSEWHAEIRRALGAAVSRLRTKHGADPSAWEWGRVRPLRVPHLLGGPGSLLARLFDLGPFAAGGDITTVAMCGSSPTDVFANPVLLANFRMAVSVGHWEDARFVLLGGQSGNPLSPHYDDMVPLWQRGEGVPIPWSQEAVERATVATLHLLPSS
jgi:penicillin amidase